MKIELPQVGESVTEGIIGKWLVSVGDEIRKYDPLVEVITDKVNMEMPSPVTGTLTAILAEEGITVPMGSAIAEISTSEDPSPESEDSTPNKMQIPDSPGTTGILLKNTAPVGPTGSGNVAVRTDDDEVEQEPRKKNLRYSPAVQRLADSNNVDLTKIEGTGINERVTRKDVEKYLKVQSTESPKAPFSQQKENLINDQIINVSPIRKMIADNMVKSATLIPHAWSQVEIDVSNMVLARTNAVADFRKNEGINLTFLPFVLKSVSQALKNNPLLNSSWNETQIILKKQINIGIAIAAEEGLVVPVVHDADLLSIAGLARKVHELTEKARTGKLDLQDVQGGTFTVNNTGVLGSTSSQPLINYPQAAIVTTEAIIKKPVVINDAIAIRSMMNMCLSFDHRIMDGREVGEFNIAMKNNIESIDSSTPIY